MALTGDMDAWLARVPRLHGDIGVTRVGDRLLASGSDDHLHAFEDASGERSEVAERIVELADGKRTVGAIVEALCEEFDVPKDQCAMDTVAFVSLLVARKVLVLG